MDGKSATGAFSTGEPVHAAKPSITQNRDRIKLVNLFGTIGKNMWILLLEAGVALFLLIFIVWWTMSGKKPDRPAAPQAALPPREDNSPSNPDEQHPQ
ncbi:hypothetical protein Q8A64_11685 [Oxalobacteraceae bacterium R-40]|uniref:Uncharacterized protein n=1 Tax=Keguizhuia sedimenti TaxID=3064264 RepID=A0ABU1BS28_9BURK|nr:hypothetical protein [Oxalobacteraceae bacterium R-40]